jgi:hypothetical protein
MYCGIKRSKAMKGFHFPHCEHSLQSQERNQEKRKGQRNSHIKREYAASKMGDDVITNMKWTTDDYDCTSLFPFFHCSSR